MNIEKLKEWLETTQDFTKATIQNRLSNLRKIESYYPNLDQEFDRDHCQRILKELEYTIDEYRLGQPVKHKIEINGNQFTGTATYRSTLKLFVEFKLFELDEREYKDIEEVVSDNTLSVDFQGQIVSLLNEFKYTQKQYRKKVDILQADLLAYLSERVESYDWKIEHQPSKDCRDSVDIYGYSEKENFHIVIEIDAHRADQVAKKFLSRTALFANENVFYISLCYPGTKKMSKTECTKYFNYCAGLSEFMSEKTKIKKMYLGYYLK